MRLLTHIIAFYIILLTSLPTLSVVTNFVEKQLCKVVCCSAPSKKPESKDCPINNDENPCCPACASYMCYSICLGNPQNESLVSFTQWGKEISRKPVTNITFTFGYNSDCWHPPKVA